MQFIKNFRAHFFSPGIAVLAVALCIPNVSRAQQQGVPSQEPQQGVAVPKPGQQSAMAGRPAHPPKPRRQLRHLTRMLNLTADQQHQMLPILRNRMKQMQAIGDNTSLSEQQRHQQMRALMMGTRQKLEAVMTSAQRQQFEQRMQQNRQRMQQRHMPRNGNMPPPPADSGNPPPPPSGGAAAQNPPPPGA
ncbi:MAG: hypothetical protein ACYDC6_03465 [Acidobacteriaceae bacterium]